MNMKQGTRFFAVMVMALVLCLNSAQAQEGIVIPISDGGVVTVDCNATETIYFTDDNSGGTDFKIHTPTRITPSRCAPTSQGTPCR